MFLFQEKGLEMKNYVKHLNYLGQEETVDASKYSEKIICHQCGSTRYIKKADYKQVARVGLCKPCIYISRKLRAIDRISRK